MAEAAPKRRGRPKGSKNRPRSDNVNDDGYFTGLSLSKIHSMWKQKTGKTTTLADWKKRWDGNTREVRKRLILQMRGLRTHKPYLDKDGNATRDKKGRVMQDTYNKDYFKGWHLERIFKLYQKRTNDYRPFEFWEGLYQKSRRRIRTALIKGLNGKLPQKAAYHGGPDGRTNNQPPRRIRGGAHRAADKNWGEIEGYVED